VSLPLSSLDVVKPQLVIMGIYYWAIYRPTLVPPSFCFVIGLLLDLLSGMPPGMNALIFVLIQWIVRDQRRFLMGQPYVTIWAVFGLVAMASALMQWGLYGLVNMNWPAPAPVLLGVLVSMLLFPLVTLLLVLTHRILPVASRAYS
jgi:rod shape-determining protein MreD